MTTENEVAEVLPLSVPLGSTRAEEDRREREASKPPTLPPLSATLRAYADWLDAHPHARQMATLAEKPSTDGAGYRALHFVCNDESILDVAASIEPGTWHAHLDVDPYFVVEREVLPHSHVTYWLYCSPDHPDALAYRAAGAEGVDYSVPKELVL